MTKAEFLNKWLSDILEEDDHDTFERDVSALVSTAEQHGWQQCLASVRGSVRDYPNAGGDIVIMTEIENIENAAAMQGMRRERRSRCQ